MAGFGIKTPWASQPQYPVALDKANNLAQRIVAISAPTLGPIVTSAKGKQYPWATDYTTRVATPSGIAYQTANATNGYITTANQTIFGGMDKISCFLIWSYSSSDSFGNVVRKDGEVTPFQIAPGGVRSALWVGGVTATSAVAVSANTWYRSLFRWKSGDYGRLKVSLSTADQLTAASKTGTIDSSAGTPLCMGSAVSASGEEVAAQIPLVVFFDHYVTDSEYASLIANPWQLFQPLERRIWVPSAGGGTTITGNPVVWQWETNNVVAKEKVSTTPTDWQWLVTTGAITEEIATTPVAWQWFVTTGSVQEGSATTITGNPIAWEWQSGTASFVQKIQGVPVNWEWQVTTGTSKEKIDSIPKAFEWQVTTGQIRGTDTIDTTPVAWTWEVTQGNVVYLQPQQTSGTIGGKKDKRVNLPYYEGKDYESRIDLEESVRDDSRSVSDFLDVRGDVLGDGARSDGKSAELVDRTSVQSGVAIGDLLAEFKEEVKPVSVIELPQVEESEGFDEEAAVIMLLLAA